jgi:demethylmenaquinone methyltransferase / 2-methoxy-6-polyprenyl-1,4-benzoquinol methylase
MVTSNPDDPLEQFRAQDLDAAMRDTQRKQGLVTPMFNVIAPRYDAFTRLFSFGMDAGWKRALVAAVISRASTASRALDVACGTGDIALSLAAAKPALYVSGIDPSEQMLAMARKRRTSESDARVDFELGTLAALPVPASSVDIITVGYGFRNVPELESAIRECARVLRPGGVLGSLDFFLPRNALWRALFLLYLRVAGDVVGWLWHRTPAIYGYIARSIETFVTAETFRLLLQTHGFKVETEKRMLFGGVAMHVAIRDASET